MRALFVPDILSAAGLQVELYPGWESRGSNTFGPVVGIVCHGTGGSNTSTDAGETRTIAITGSNTADAPIAQAYLSRSGKVVVCASGTCTGVKTGTAGALKGLGDDSVYQIEAQHNGSEPWTPTQYWAYVRMVAALVAYKAPGWDVTVGRVVGHSEHQPGEKPDPWLDMGRFRRDVEFILRGDGDMLLMKVAGDTKIYIKEGGSFRWLTTGADPAAGKALSILLQNGYRIIEFDNWAQLKVVGGRFEGDGPAPGDPIDQNAFADRVTAAVVDGITGLQFIR